MAFETWGSEGTFWAVIVGAGTLVINIVVAIVNGISTLNHARQETDDKIAVHGKQAIEDLINLERRVKTDIDYASRNFGETMSAVRTKITEVELFGRDHYVDKATFQAFATDWRRSWDRFEEKLDGRLDRIDDKLNQK